MKRLFAMFVLTPPEQRLVVFVVLALVLGFSVKHHRDLKVGQVHPNNAEQSPVPPVSPTPNER